ncbi:IS3 transposase [Salmonella enterica subsp. enterica]|nr:IS3 transposase [Salmonella enterica subsp. enterica] [Salmonella enterica subsp. enterica serovar Virchow]
MTKPASTTKKPRKQHTPEFRQEALKLAERIGGGGPLPPANLTCMNHSSTTGEANSKISSLLLNASRRCPLRSPV